MVFKTEHPWLRLMGSIDAHCLKRSHYSVEKKSEEMDFSFFKISYRPAILNGTIVF